MNTNSVVTAIREGRLGAAILDTWARATIALVLAAIALVVAVACGVFIIMSNL